MNDVKIIHAGKVLENSKTLADSRVTFGDLPAGVVTMHVVIQPPAAKKKMGWFNFTSFMSQFVTNSAICGYFIRINEFQTVQGGLKPC